MSKQDVYNSVSLRKSAEWQELVRREVEAVDPEFKTLEFIPGDLDIKVYIKAKMGGNIFHKGHGIRLFAQHMDLDLKEGNILVCGDTETDLEMLHECLSINPKHTYTVWVTQNEKLRERVKEICEEVGNKSYVFVSCPEVILGAMSQATIREIKLRPEGSHLSAEMSPELERKLP